MVQAALPAEVTTVAVYISTHLDVWVNTAGLRDLPAKFECAGEKWALVNAAVLAWLGRRWDVVLNSLVAGRVTFDQADDVRRRIHLLQGVLPPELQAKIAGWEDVGTYASWGDGRDHRHNEVKRGEFLRAQGIDAAIRRQFAPRKAEAASLF